MVSSCNRFYLVVKNKICFDIASKFSISPEQLSLWNPALGNDCKAFWPATYICVGIIGGSESPSPTPKSTSDKPSPTTSPNGISTPSSIQAGMTTNCDEFYLVKDNDGRYDIAKKYSIALRDFYTWNPAVGDTCMKLFSAKYVGVSTIGKGPTTLITVTTSTSTKPYEIPPPCTFDLYQGQYVCPSRAATPTPTPTPTTTSLEMASRPQRLSRVV